MSAGYVETDVEREQNKRDSRNQTIKVVLITLLAVVVIVGAIYTLFNNIETEKNPMGSFKTMTRVIKSRFDIKMVSTNEDDTRYEGFDSLHNIKITMYRQLNGELPRDIFIDMDIETASEPETKVKLKHIALTFYPNMPMENVLNFTEAIGEKFEDEYCESLSVNPKVIAPSVDAKLAHFYIINKKIPKGY